MKMKAMVMSYEARSGNAAKTGKPWEMKTLTLIDMGDKPRCKTPIELMLGDADSDLGPEVEGETLLVDLTSIEAGFKGSIRAQGSVQRAPATAAGPKPAPPASK